jgi:hypothetical protein
MATTLVRIYDHFADAQKAREALLATGFPPSDVRLSTSDDEAGPAEGNFVVDRKDSDKHGFFGALSRRDPYDDTRAPQQAVHRATVMLTVDAPDDERVGRAADIMDRFGAIDVEQRCFGRKRES